MIAPRGMVAPRKWMPVVRQRRCESRCAKRLRAAHGHLREALALRQTSVCKALARRTTESRRRDSTVRGNRRQVQIPCQRPHAPPQRTRRFGQTCRLEAIRFLANLPEYCRENQNILSPRRVRSRHKTGAALSWQRSSPTLCNARGWPRTVPANSPQDNGSTPESDHEPAHRVAGRSAYRAICP